MSFKSERTGLLGGLAVCIALAACGQKPEGNPPAASSSIEEVGGGAVGKAPAGGACELLTTAEVSAVLPGAGDGEADDSRKEYGISACEWATERGVLFVQRWTLAGSSAKDEASSLALGVLDPLKGASLRNSLRYELAAGIGEDAVIVIESKDEARGVLEDIATLVARKGDQWVIMGAPDLADGDREAALASLTKLGQGAAGRL